VLAAMCLCPVARLLEARVAPCALLSAQPPLVLAPRCHLTATVLHCWKAVLVGVSAALLLSLLGAVPLETAGLPRSQVVSGARVVLYLLCPLMLRSTAGTCLSAVAQARAAPLAPWRWRLAPRLLARPVVFLSARPLRLVAMVVPFLSLVGIPPRLHRPLVVNSASVRAAPRLVARFRLRVARAWGPWLVPLLLLVGPVVALLLAVLLHVCLPAAAVLRQAGRCWSVVVLVQLVRAARPPFPAALVRLLLAARCRCRPRTAGLAARAAPSRCLPAALLAASAATSLCPLERHLVGRAARSLCLLARAAAGAAVFCRCPLACRLLVLADLRRLRQGLAALVVALCASKAALARVVLVVRFGCPVARAELAPAVPFLCRRRMQARLGRAAACLWAVALARAARLAPWR